MRAIVLLILLLNGSSCTAVETMELIKQLGDDCYDIRQAATTELSKLPREFAIPIWLESHEQTDPEITWRLQTVAREIFRRCILTQDERWRRLHGWLGIEASLVYSQTNIRLLIGFRVSWVFIDSPSGDFLMDGDMITEVDGKTPDKLQAERYFGYGWETLGQDHTLKVIHTNPDAKVKEETVTLTPIMAPAGKFNYVSDSEVCQERWEAFKHGASLMSVWYHYRRLLSRAIGR